MSSSRCCLGTSMVFFRPDEALTPGDTPHKPYAPGRGRIDKCRNQRRNTTGERSLPHNIENRSTPPKGGHRSHVAPEKDIAGSIPILNRPPRTTTQRKCGMRPPSIRGRSIYPVGTRTSWSNGGIERLMLVLA